MNRLTNGWYQGLVRSCFFRMEAERAHDLALGLLRAAPHFPGALSCLRSFAPLPAPVELFGLRFRNPVGLAAGFDKNGTAIPAWEALGFGFVEIGTVTAKPQAGNPPPRIFRFPEQAAIINRLGFNNEGADAIADRLRRLRASQRAPKIPIGVNLGKSRVTPLEEAASDYLYSFRQLQSVADYIALNVSSPNTPGLRSLQEEAALNELLGTISEENARLSTPKPLLLKIAPDLADEAIAEVVAVCEKFGIAGIIATNTTLDHSAIGIGDETGGLSGAPLSQRSTEIVRLIRARSDLPIVGVGGISDARSAREKREAGAQLLQVYTGYVYRGPGLLREIAHLT